MKSQLYVLWPCFLRRTAKLHEMTAIPTIAMFLKEDSLTTWHDSYTYYDHITLGWQQNYLKWRLYLLLPCFLRRTATLHEMTDFLMRTAKLPEMTAMPIMDIFLEQDSETTWNVSYTFYGHVSWELHWNYLKWQLYLFWPCFLTKIVKLLEMSAIPIMAIFLLEDSEPNGNDSYTYYGHVSWPGQRNYVKWQLNLFWPCFLRIPVKLPEMTAIAVMAMFLEDYSEPTCNDSYICYGHVSWGGQGNYLKWQLYLFGHVSWGGQWNYPKWQWYLLWPSYLRTTAKLPETTAIPI